MNGLEIYKQHPKYIACIDNSSFQHTHFKANPVYAQEYPSSLIENIFDKTSAKTFLTFESSGKIYFRALTNFTSTFPYYGIQPGQCIWSMPPSTDTEVSQLNFYNKNYGLISASNTEQAIRYENIDGDRYTNVILYKVLRQTGNRIVLPKKTPIELIQSISGESVGNALSSLNNLWMGVKYI